MCVMARSYPLQVCVSMINCTETKKEYEKSLIGHGNKEGGIDLKVNICSQAWFHGMTVRVSAVTEKEW